ncbi:MAG: OmpH family outer membrane protein [Smithella sp.]|jgi:outer membrane protein
MKKITAMVISVFLMGMMTCLAEAATIGYIEVQKVFSSYEKTKKAQEQMGEKEKEIQAEIEKKQKQVEKERANGASDKELRKMVEKFEKELDPKRKDITEAQQKITQEIEEDIIKASEEAAKKMNVEAVINKQVVITGGVDLTDKVIEILNKK